MERRSTILLTTILVIPLAVACSDDDPNLKLNDAGTGTDSDTDTDTDSDTDTDTDSDTDSGESETPPDLPALCTANVMDLPASGEGDGRWPTIAAGESVLIAWAYDEQEGAADWDIQLATYDVGLSDPTEPFEPSIVAEMPFLAARDIGFGIGWLDTRWDSSCSVANQNACQREIAFITLDATGQPTNPNPTRITYGANADQRPVVSATETGFLIVWSDRDGGETNIMVVAIDESGNPAEPQLVSGEETGALERQPSIAAVGETAVATWLAYDQNHVLGRTLTLDGTPSGEVFVVDEGNLSGTPSIAGSADGFMVSWTTKKFDDFEVYTRRLDTTGAPIGEVNRATWTTRDAREPRLAWGEAGWAMIWVCAEANGTGTCIESSCREQTFATLLNDDGTVASKEVRLVDDPNRCQEPTLIGDDGGWSAVWEVRKDMRQQVFFGRMTCE